MPVVIDENTGALTTTRKIDREESASYSFTVVATDKGNPPLVRTGGGVDRKEQSLGRTGGGKNREDPFLGRIKDWGLYGRNEYAFGRDWGWFAKKISVLGKDMG